MKKHYLLHYLLAILIGNCRCVDVIVTLTQTGSNRLIFNFVYYYYCKMKQLRKSREKDG